MGSEVSEARGWPFVPGVLGLRVLLTPLPTQTPVLLTLFHPRKHLHVVHRLETIVAFLRDWLINQRVILSLLGYLLELSYP